MTRAADTKHLNSFDDLYHSLRYFRGSYLFTSHGLTTGRRGRIGMPEFIIRRGLGVLIEGESEIWKITRDGKQTLYAVFEEGRFIVLK